MEWFYESNNDKKGPVSKEALTRLVEQGFITNETLIWRAGFDGWQAYGAIAEVEGLPAPGAAPDPDTEICVVSGKRYPRREMVEYEGKWIGAEHRDTFFQRLREGVPLETDSLVPGPYGYAEFWRRFIAVVVDGIIMAVVGGIVGAVIGGIVGASGALTTQNSILVFQALMQLVGIALGITYEVIFIRKYDATPGKMAMGIKLVRASGESLSAGRIIGRYFAKFVSAIILLIGYLMAGWDPEHRALHDRMCDTRVIKTRK